jgi:branched-subunit amino acid aminotransferase/4-amino-4-deoxychorismate lyase
VTAGRRAPAGAGRAGGTAAGGAPHGPAGAPLVWLNGDIVARDAAALPLLDRGARDGEGLFETLRVTGGEPWLWHAHVERLVVSAAELGFPVPPSPALLRRALAELARATGLDEAVARITVTRGRAGARPARSGCWIELEPLAARRWRRLAAGGVRALRSLRAFEPGTLGRYKTTSRLAWNLARDEARARGADEALLLAADGQLLEGATSNVFVVAGGALLTPPLDRNVLPGIVRGRVLALAARLGIPTRETPIGPGVLARAEEVLLTNSVQEIAWVAELDGAALPSRAVGEALAAAWRESVRPG